MVGYDGKDISSLVVSLRDRTMVRLNPKSVNLKATQTNQKCKKKKNKTKRKGKPIFRTHW